MVLPPSSQPRPRERPVNVRGIESRNRPQPRRLLLVKERTTQSATTSMSQIRQNGPEKKKNESRVSSVYALARRNGGKEGRKEGIETFPCLFSTRVVGQVKDSCGRLPVPSVQKASLRLEDCGQTGRRSASKVRDSASRSPGPNLRKKTLKRETLEGLSRCDYRAQSGHEMPDKIPVPRLTQRSVGHRWSEFLTLSSEDDPRDRECPRGLLSLKSFDLI